MYWAIRQILTPLRYLKIQQGISTLKSKVVYDWIFPVILALATTWLFAVYASGDPLFSERGVIGGFQKLLELLVPFYIAALAAVSTFNREGLDDKMKGVPATLSLQSRHAEKGEVQILTRRQFICYLFGYLAFLSLFLFLFIVLFRLTGPRIALEIASLVNLPDVIGYLRVIVLFVFLFPLWQLIVITMLGVYFMCERLQVMTDTRL
jgi:hypothetical protein